MSVALPMVGNRTNLALSFTNISANIAVAIIRIPAENFRCGKQ
jgi:hypothetical protein